MWIDRRAIVFPIRVGNLTNSPRNGGSQAMDLCCGRPERHPNWLSTIAQVDRTAGRKGNKPIQSPGPVVADVVQAKVPSISPCSDRSKAAESGAF